ncbi:MAG: hypothetical protein LBV43_10075 [Prevotella sp.]|jgi:hypothetical protein|nr:hypothetical protein [Prevotella sp.]
METPNLDNYIFQSFDKIKDLNIKSINFILESQEKLDLGFLKYLFEDLKYELEEKIIKQFLFKSKYEYSFQIKLNSPIDRQEYILFIGKIFTLCGKLYAEIKTFGINA